jgi:hypothetical protein
MRTQGTCCIGRTHREEMTETDRRVGSVVRAVIVAVMVALLLAPGMALGQDVDASAAIYAEPMASIEASGPAELWSPVELADIPFWYTCGRAFHAVDLEEAPTGLEVDPPIPTTRPIVFNDGTDAMAVSVRDPGRSPQEGALWYREYERTEDGWGGQWLRHLRAVGALSDGWWARWLLAARPSQIRTQRTVPAHPPQGLVRPGMPECRPHHGSAARPPDRRGGPHRRASDGPAQHGRVCRWAS